MKIRTMLAAMMAAAMATSAMAAPLVPGAGWTKFFFGATGSPIYDSTTSDLTYDFTLAAATTLKVTDAYNPGDIFQISDFGNVIGTTSTPAGGSSFTSNPDTAYADPDFSHGAFTLAAGAHSISGIVTVSPFEAGGAFIELAGAAVPEPASWALMLAGFAGVGLAARRHRTTVAA